MLSPNRGSFVIFLAFAVVVWPSAMLQSLMSPCIAAEIEVDNVLGSDRMARFASQADRSTFRTIQAAINSASTGDVIRLRATGVPYHECVSINSRDDWGTPEFPLIIEGNGAILDGSLPLSTLDWTSVGGDLFELNVPSPGYVHLTAASDQPTPEYVGRISDVSGLQPLQYARRSATVLFRTRPGDVPQAYGLKLNRHQTGITFYETSHIVVRNLTIRGFRLDGVNCHDLVDDVRLINVTFEENGRSGLSVGGSSHITCASGKFRSNGHAQVRVEGHALLNLQSAAIDAGSAIAIQRDGGTVVESR